MAQKIFRETGLMMEDGRTIAEYQADPDWDPLIHDVVDVVQTFEDSVPYFWFPTLNQFFKSTRRVHAIFRAAKTLFSASRWEEIRDALESRGGLLDHLANFDIPSVREKVIKARDAGLITVAETQDLAQLIAHLPT